MTFSSLNNKTHMSVESGKNTPGSSTLLVCTLGNAVAKAILLRLRQTNRQCRFLPHRKIDPYKISTINKILSDFTYFAKIFKEFKQKNGLYLYLQ